MKSLPQNKSPNLLQPVIPEFAAMAIPGAADVALWPIVPPPAHEHAPSVYLAGLAEGSRDTMVSALNTMARLLTSGRCDLWSLNWPKLRYVHVQALRAALAHLYAVATANRMLCALRGVLTAAWRLDQMPGREYARAVDVKPIRGKPLERGRALQEAELRALFAACLADPHPAAGARDAAMLAILCATGLRRSELVALDLEDYEADLGPAGVLYVQAGKGNKGREVYLTPPAREATGKWLAHRGIVPGPLLLPLSWSGRVQARRMSAQTVMDILSRRASQCGVAAFTPHDLRRTWVSNMLAAGVDLSEVKELAGHADVSTTARYDRRGAASRARAAQRALVPYIGTETPALPF